MTTYAGEFTIVAATATVEVGPGVFEALTDADGVTADLTIYMPADTGVPRARFELPLIGGDALDAAPMTWDAAGGFWSYEWDTTGVEAGRYDTRVRFTGPGNRLSWEYGVVKLTADKAVAP